jgi:predicted lipid-binding transport protein (Tim44 family)
MIWVGVLLITIVFGGLAGMAYFRAGEKMSGAVYGLSTLAVISLLSGLWVAPQYRVWQQQLEGKAELARAEQNRQILINEAMAKRESSKHWADAEIERARGAAEANRIVAESLGGPEGYLRWLFIEKLDEIKSGQVIYLPTEAGVPILEANRLK